VNGDCEVLRGQVQRANGGLYYRSYEEFAETLTLLLTDQELNRRLGESGHRYYQANYDWDIILGKYERALRSVAAAGNGA
ncbi:glycosyltransferase, partial [bacterium]|nr:glycosyltransferase [candidate division CSSED10-310 bacterium]